MKYVILIPIYNDRESLKLLVENINSQIKNLNHEVSLVVINDASSQQIIDTYPIQPLFTRVIISLNRKQSTKSGIILPSNPLLEEQYVIAAGPTAQVKPGDKIILDLDKMTVKKPSKSDVTEMIETIKVDPIVVEGFDVYAVIYDNQIKAKYK